MGLLDNTDLGGQWINDGKSLPVRDEDFYADDPAPLFRKTFSIQGKIEKARFYISGLGYNVAYLNGKRIGDHELDPGWTGYAAREFYSTYDVTDLLIDGKNCLSVTLGNGWFNPLPLRMWGGRNIRDALFTGKPSFICRLSADAADGSKTVIVSDETWKVHDGPIIRNNIYLGEVYDARREVSGWNLPGFDDQDWKTASVTDFLPGSLRAQPQPPIKIRAEIKPVNLTSPGKGVYIFDMGQNFAGWIRLKIRAAKGTTIRLRYGELLYDDGTLNPMTGVCGQIKGKRKNAEGEMVNIGGPGSPEIAWQSDTYIAKGEGTEEFTPAFTFHAFRYVEVTGLESSPRISDCLGLRLSSAVETVGTFECSDTLINAIQKMCTSTFLSNIFSIQSDCPHRERFQYGGDIVATSEAFMYNFDMSSFYGKTVQDWTDAAREDGRFTDTAPFVGIQYCGIGWAMVQPLLQLQLLRFYGNLSLVREQYPAAKRWIDLVIRRESGFAHSFRVE